MNDPNPVSAMTPPADNNTFSSSLEPRQLTHVGSNVECSVLARAVQWVAERRVLLNGHKTVVFDS
jgi:formyltetrahydrofolate hydrolase